MRLPTRTYENIVENDRFDDFCLNGNFFKTQYLLPTGVKLASGPVVPREAVDP